MADNLTWVFLFAPVSLAISSDLRKTEILLVLLKPPKALASFKWIPSYWYPGYLVLEIIPYIPDGICLIDCCTLKGGSVFGIDV